LAQAVAALGYVVLSIDGPRAGLSTGGPQDTEQTCISVEEVMNVPSPAVSYLYHYVYAGMRALTLLDALSRIPFNPLRLDRNNFGVIGTSMGGQFPYYLNGVDERMKGPVVGQFEVNIECVVDPRRRPQVVDMKVTYYRGLLDIDRSCHHWLYLRLIPADATAPASVEWPEPHASAPHLLSYYLTSHGPEVMQPMWVTLTWSPSITLPLRPAR
jgi:hypothetical protein